MSTDFLVDEHNAVQPSRELDRVVALPRRVITDAQAEEYARDATDALRLPWGRMQLRPVQGSALHDITEYGSFFGPITVGGGKTLISFYASLCAESKRPLLSLPAKLVAKTHRNREELRRHWQLPEHLRIVTCEWMGRKQAADMLESYQPDHIILDEAHKYKNRRAACTRRLLRYLKAHPTCRLTVMSGTITKRSILDYAHLARYCLRDRCPLPSDYNELEMWADALDERKGQTRRADPGALIALCNDEELALWEEEPRRAARMAFRRRLVETPGVVATTGHDGVDATIVITRVDPPASTAIDAAFDDLRSAWELPDGHPMVDGLEVYRHARELCQGFFYVWDPPPPPEWMAAKKAWCAFARAVLSRSHTLDSEGQVKEAYPDEPLLLSWQEIEPTFKPNTVPVWICRSVLEFCAAWLKENVGGICWIEHVWFGRELAKMTGLPYFGAGNAGDAEHWPGSMILSIEAGREGLNLQHGHSINLIVSPPPNGERVEQLAGRTHRPGQDEDEVEFHYAAFCAEHYGAFWQAMRDCQYVRDSTGQPQKLLIADHDFTTELPPGSRYNK